MEDVHKLLHDFHSHWMRNRLFEWTHLSKIERVFEKDGRYLIIYKYRKREGKFLRTHIFKFNTLTKLYEINTTRYGSYFDAYNALWKLEDNPPF
jgi:hypothetical protein